MRPAPGGAILTNSRDLTTDHFTPSFTLASEAEVGGAADSGVTCSVALPVAVVADAILPCPDTPRLGRYPLLSRELNFDTVRPI